MPPKRDTVAEQEAQAWIQEIIGEKFPGEYDKSLKNGVILCKLMQKLLPGSIKKIVETGTDFKLMENINAFSAAARKYGIDENELFQTVDLWTLKGIPSVTKCIHALGRHAQRKPDWTGPILGPKMADAQKREFTQEQLDAGKHVVNTFQMGFTGGASQAGMNLGKQRSVHD
ncbi:myophilin-like [Lineus longissimus]|uniref:myophilin-like n=1 Tax=Lineus longissimus TaxID=88925 RepID=UPI00315DB800